MKAKRDFENNYLYRFPNNVVVVVDNCAYTKHDPKEKVYYFLTHFHSDHTGGLSNKWSKGPLYCSSITKKLLLRKYPRFGPKLLVEISQTNVIYSLRDCNTITVRAYCANHCPGALMYYFTNNELSSDYEYDGKKVARTVLVTGDFRFDRSLAVCQQWCSVFSGKTDVLICDATYGLPKYHFLSQRETITQCIRQVRESLIEFLTKKNISGIKTLTNEEASALSDKELLNATPCLVLVDAAYTIGKEKLLLGLQAAFEEKIYVPTKEKREILFCIFGSDYQLYFSDSPSSRIQIATTEDGNNSRAVIQKFLTSKDSSAVLINSAVEATTMPQALILITATGWNGNKNAVRPGGYYNKEEKRFVLEPRLTKIEVCYSEHCNYPELLDFFREVKPKTVFFLQAQDIKSNNEMIKQFPALTIGGDIVSILRKITDSGKKKGQNKEQKQKESNYHSDIPHNTNLSVSTIMTTTASRNNEKSNEKQRFGAKQNIPKKTLLDTCSEFFQIKVSPGVSSSGELAHHKTYSEMVSSPKITISSNKKIVSSSAFSNADNEEFKNINNEQQSSELEILSSFSVDELDSYTDIYSILTISENSSDNK